MDAIYALPGDVFFTRSSSLLGRLIRWAEHDPKEEDGAWANHVGVVTMSGWIVPPKPRSAAWCFAVVVESLWRTMRWEWFPAHKKEVGNEIRVYRLKNGLPSEQWRAFGDEANKFIGAKYGWWKLFAHLGDRVFFRGRKFLSGQLTIDGRPICSFRAAHIFAAAGVSFGVDPDAADPDEMMDHCERSEEWVLVGSSKIDEEVE